MGDVRVNTLWAAARFPCCSTVLIADGCLKPSRPTVGSCYRQQLPACCCPGADALACRL